MKLHVQVDNLLELIGAGLVVWGVYVLAGKGFAIIAAAVAVILLAEFSLADSRFSVTLPKLRRKAKP